MSGTARTRIKICGITTVATAEAAVAAGADAIGLVRVQESPRCVDDRTCAQILDALPPLVSAVGVYRNAGAERLREPLAARFALLQLHGDEDEQDVAAAGRPVIRGFAFSTEQVLRWDRCPGVAALLLDGPAAGSGRAFDHAELIALRPRLHRPIILAGGLTPKNVAAAIAAVRPYAVDVSSGVESSPGVKDPAKIEAFCEAVRAAGA